MNFPNPHWNQYLPKSILCLKDYSARIFAADLAAGVTVGLVALPLAMAFAIASGLTPQAGIYCAVVTGFIISLLGGSKTQIGGPTGAFVVVIAGILAKHGVHGLFLCTMMAGVMLVIMGLTGLGKAVQFIPAPGRHGLHQRHCGADCQHPDSRLLRPAPGAQPRRIFRAHEASWSSTPAPSRCRPPRLAAASLVIILVTPRISKRVPGYIVALVAGTAAAALLHLPVETIGTRFGGIPSGLPHLQMPEFHTSLILPLISSAVTIAMLGAIESLMSAVVADNMSGDKHNPNVELVAQGVANILSPIFGGLPATGAIARTATNIRSGGRTPVAGIIHSLTLLAVLLFAAPLARFIPMAVLASILIRRQLQHGAVGRDLAFAAGHQVGDCGVAGHLRPHGDGRSDDGGRVRHDPRRAHLHSQRGGDHFGFCRNQRLHPHRALPTFCTTSTSRITSRSSACRERCCLAPRKNWRSSFIA